MMKISRYILVLLLFIFSNPSQAEVIYGQGFTFGTYACPPYDVFYNAANNFFNGPSYDQYIASGYSRDYLWVMEYCSGGYGIYSACAQRIGNIEFTRMEGKYCFYDSGQNCPTGTTATYSGGVKSCVQSCNQPENTPCDVVTDPSRRLSCSADLTWDSSTCSWKHSQPSCDYSEGGGPLEGIYPGSMPLGSTTCFFGCEYMVTASSGGQQLVQTTGSNCEVADNPPAALDTGFSDGENTAIPDPGTESNCYTINGENICLDPIPDTDCYKTTQGNVICTGNPAPSPNTLKPVDPTPGPDISINQTDISNTTNTTINYYSGGTIINQGGGIVNCPTGYTYQNGLCTQSPTNGECPPGATLQGGTCVYTNIGKFGTFGGPSGEYPTGPEIPEYDYTATLSNVYSTLSSANLLNISLNCSSSSFQCTPLTVMGQSTTIHCELIEYAIPFLQYALWGIAGVIAIRVALTA